MTHAALDAPGTYAFELEVDDGAAAANLHAAAVEMTNQNWSSKGVGCAKRSAARLLDTHRGQGLVLCPVTQVELAPVLGGDRGAQGELQ